MQARQLPLALESPPHFTQEDLVVSQANARAFAALQAWPHWLKPTMLLIGTAGSGKSHMACLWAAKAQAHHFTPDQLDDARHALELGRSIVVEDMHPGAFDQTALFHLLNAVAQIQLEIPTVGLLMTSRFDPNHWQIGLADLASRLKAVQRIEIAPPDDLLLQAVLTKLFADRQLMVEPQLIHYCVRRMERSFEAAQRFVTEIDRLALEKKSKMTRGLAKQALTQL